MRLILIFLTALLLLIQFPLWLGKGGWLRVWDLDKQVSAAVRRNDELRARNTKLASEVEDLKQGTGAVEERARFELGMIKDDEIFVQVLTPDVGSGVPGGAPGGSAPPTITHTVPTPNLNTAQPPAAASP
ncbi:MAG: cell division protein FtsB [Burkholderiaceae bacterium]